VITSIDYVYPVELEQKDTTEIERGGQLRRFLFSHYELLFLCSNIAAASAY
jgi:hypothetical protein